MSQSDKSFYEVLGVSESATQEEIKKRYRELARKYHPDVASNKEMAAPIFALVTEAYKTLSDGEARRGYDAELLLKKRRQEEVQRRSAPPAAPSGGRATSDAARAAQSESERLVVQAQAAFVRNKMVEARNLAEQSLRYNRRNAVAYEVLGDVCRVQGRTDDAIGHYTMVLQLDPRNLAVRQRMERLARSGGPRATVGGGYVRSTSASPLKAVPQEKRPMARMLLGTIGYALVLALLLIGALLSGDWKSAGLPLVADWSWPLIALLTLCGIALGCTMALTGAIRRVEDDFLLRSSGANNTSPMGCLMIFIGALCFWVAALVHLAVAVVQESFATSLLRVYGGIAAVTLVAWVALGGGWATPVLGGNVVFIAFLLGWFLGDAFRDN